MRDKPDGYETLLETLRDLPVGSVESRALARRLLEERPPSFDVCFHSARYSEAGELLTSVCDSQTASILGVSQVQYFRESGETFAEFRARVRGAQAADDVTVLIFWPVVRERA